MKQLNLTTKEIELIRDYGVNCRPILEPCPVLQNRFESDRQCFV